MPSRPLVAPLTVLVLATGCTASPTPGPTPPGPEGRDAPAIRLVSYEPDCRRLTEQLRKAAQASVGPWGFAGGGYDLGMPEAAAADAIGGRAQRAAGAAPSAYSRTNNHEAGADEPDLVKTDGRRILTTDRGVLRVVDAETRKQTAELDLGFGEAEAELLLAGDRALVLATTYGGAAFDGPAMSSRIAAPGRTRVIQIDLTGQPRVTGSYSIDASLVDGRMTGTTARVVVRSVPRIPTRGVPDSADDDKRIDAHRKAIGAAPIDAWLPSYRVGDRTGRIPCDAVRTPPVFSGGSLVTVLTFDLLADLGDGAPVTLAADGNTVYGTTSSLYVAHDESWRSWRRPSGWSTDTDLFRFDITGARAEYRSAGRVPGRLINQYALSEHDGHLRAATTTGWGDDSESRVTVLSLDGGSLRKVGSVGGLGKTEQIHAVRFLGDRGYVVTFRQTDPLYSLDLSDPARPRVTGELKIPGYSAHLQPIGDDRLVGIGQDADERGGQLGSQVSLFDVADPARPARLAQHRVRNAHSEAEWNPHAVLWWPATNLLVVPVQQYTETASRSSALALRVGADGLTKAGEVTHPGTLGNTEPAIRRTLVVGDVLWTVSDHGIQANDLAGLDRLAWLAY